MRTFFSSIVSIAGLGIFYTSNQPTALAAKRYSITGSVDPGENTGGQSRMAKTKVDNTSVPLQTPVRVLVIGSSVAAGWRDNPLDGGYIKRSFEALSDNGRGQYVIYNKAIPGARITDIEHDYPGWIASIQPDIVMIAWGTLNDLHAKTPLTTFDEQVRWQILTALNQHAMVFVVATPVSEASFTTYRWRQALWVENELNIARSIHNVNVQGFNVFQQMKAYLAKHHEPYEPLMADGWHPNSEGHQLAAQLLTIDIKKFFTSRNSSLV